MIINKFLLIVLIICIINSCIDYKKTDKMMKTKSNDNVLLGTASGESNCPPAQNNIYETLIDTPGFYIDNNDVLNHGGAIVLIGYRPGWVKSQPGMNNIYETKSTGGENTILYKPDIKSVDSAELSNCNPAQKNIYQTLKK